MTHFSERNPVVKRRISVSVAFSVNLFWKFFKRTSSSKRDFHENPLSDSDTFTHNFLVYWSISLKFGIAHLHVTTISKNSAFRTKRCSERTPCILFLCFWRNSPQWARASSFTRFLHHTVGRAPLDEWSARRRDLYLTTHNTHNRQTSMSPVGFEPTTPAGGAAADLRLRPRGHRDRHTLYIIIPICVRFSKGHVYKTLMGILCFLHFGALRATH